MGMEPLPIECRAATNEAWMIEMDCFVTLKAESRDPSDVNQRNEDQRNEDQRNEDQRNEVV